LDKDVELVRSGWQRLVGGLQSILIVTSSQRCNTCPYDFLDAWLTSFCVAEEGEVRIIHVDGQTSRSFVCHAIVMTLEVAGRKGLMPPRQPQTMR